MLEIHSTSCDDCFDLRCWRRRDQRRCNFGAVWRHCERMCDVCFADHLLDDDVSHSMALEVSSNGSALRNCDIFQHRSCALHRQRCRRATLGRRAVNVYLSTKLTSHFQSSIHIFISIICCSHFLWQCACKTRSSSRRTCSGVGRRKRSFAVHC